MIAAAAVALAAAASTPVGVGLDEYSLALYRSRVRAGSVRFTVRNLGEDRHDLVVRTPGGRIKAALPELAPGERATLRVRLRSPGVYRLACTVADHEDRGMLARLRVLRR